MLLSGTGGHRAAHRLVCGIRRRRWQPITIRFELPQLHGVHRRGKRVLQGVQRLAHFVGRHAAACPTAAEPNVEYRNQASNVVAAEALGR
jgi:hypothetical protein